MFGFTTWFTVKGDGTTIQAWKWKGRDDLFVVTDDEVVLAVISRALDEAEL